MSRLKEPFDSQFIKLSNLIVFAASVLLLVVVSFSVALFFAPEIITWISSEKKTEKPVVSQETPSDLWVAPDESLIPLDTHGDEIRYGKDLIVNTSRYLGPKGTVKSMSNGMNCQNCHLEAGTKPFGNNYSAVASTYPKFRPRSGMVETIEKRVNDCFERSLNGEALDDDSKEMKAIVAYIRWLGADVPKGVKPNGVGLVEMAFINRPANPERGKELFSLKCVECHGANGEGIPNAEGSGWIYPPVWGENSFNSGAGLFRLSRFAGYIKANMPFLITVENPVVTDEEAWDIAAYVTSMPRPKKDLTADWPDIAKKPVDHPFGPFIDDFSEVQHKYGPFKPIIEKQKELMTMSKGK
ncbi:MAG: c-type cytochrome [Cyclobacteriaceae bacterium]|nr:c-type cytochrome [Cyclobacteriaceae bacterium]